MTTSRVPRLPFRYILWVDPGTMNGWALYYVDDDILVQAEYTFDELVRYLDRWLSTASGATVVGCERFVITANSARRAGSVAALQAWGAVEAAISRHGAFDLITSQNSASALGFTRDAVLRELGWYKQTMPHANDAARHIYRFLAGMGWLTEDQKSKIFSD